MNHISHFLVLLWAAGPLTRLESISDVPYQWIGKTGKLCDFLFFLQPGPRPTFIVCSTVHYTVNEASS